MPDDHTLRELLRLALQGHQDACTELVRHLEPVIRRAVRVHLPRNDPLRRLFDSMDICQSVLVQFLARAGLGAIQFQSPRTLRRLLRRMAVQRFIDKKREAEARRRDHRANAAGEAAARAADPSAPCPDDLAATRELYQAVCRRLSERERQIAELWASGRSFPEISEQVRGADGRSIQPNAVRMALQRALLRVARELPQE